MDGRQDAECGKCVRCLLVVALTGTTARFVHRAWNGGESVGRLKSPAMIKKCEDGSCCWTCSLRYELQAAEARESVGLK